MPSEYRLQFIPSADKEWRKLNHATRQQFAKKLVDRLIEPHVSSAKLSDMTGCYKIKLRQSGYRLVYQVIEDIVVVRVIAVGRRSRNAVYKAASQRI